MRREGETEDVDGAHFDIAAVYYRYRELMHRVAFARLRDSGRTSEAGDVVQDVIVGLMGSPPTGVKNWESYLVRAVQNKVTDRLRSAAVKHDGGPVDEVSELERPSDADVGTDVVEAIDLVRRAGIVWDCLSALGDRERRVLWEHVAKDRPRKDVANEFGVTPQRVTQLKNAGLKKLAVAMKAKGVHE
ncbi:sigma-70 family RNA polymerase sigma factor [Gordonia sp. (in: high G+C Gram-positive bacteria)]|uniref:sigma-70 family RNA polymerase sigma factor n=1 Tax=Gordonia sp. (in: high G+C Gram-positive bacteria) TaxID=84139 RepID=UPI00257FD2DF|nr:sigma-70 family RNA polymerase sigma factor [Gordonia sp. (in: high G+C Gram-positive bacteria)]